MDTQTMIVLVALLFAIIVITGLIIFRRKAKIKMGVSGNSLEFDGSNEPKKNDGKPQPRHGIFGNWSIGETHIETSGKATVEDNKSVGKTDIKARNK